MKYLITLDAGTTNTRAILWNENRDIVFSEMRSVGVRDTAIDGNNLRLKQAVKECVSDLLKKAGIDYSQIDTIVASGMITSNVGLLEIPHLIAPIGIEDLVSGIQAIELPEICPLPIWFIPGVKNFSDSIDYSNLETMDIMRGEEVEAVYIIQEYYDGRPLILILPGSHTKFISVSADGLITGCLTTITGELLSVITNKTIIADAVNHSFVESDTYKEDVMLKGFDLASKVGLGRACFSGRILNQFVTKDATEIANFILGAVLQNDLEALKNSKAIKASPKSLILIAGKDPLRQALKAAIDYDGYFTDTKNIMAEGDKSFSALGAHILVERRKRVEG